MKKILISCSILFLAIVSFSQTDSNDAVKNNAMYLGRYLRVIENYYVESIDLDSLSFEMVKSTTEDMNSRLVRRDEFQKQGYDIGIEYFISKDGYPIVINTKIGSPADGKLLPKDKLIKINSKKTKGLNSEKIEEEVSGNKGVDLEYIRNNQNGTITIEPGVFNDKKIISCLYGNIAYIKIFDFNEVDLSGKVKNHANDLLKNGATQFIIDLRDNTGGYLKECIGVLSLFIENGQKIIDIHFKNDIKSYYSQDGLYDQPLIVLCNEKTSVGAEMVAGVIQDLDRGIVVGQKTTGNTIIRQSYHLTNGDILSLHTGNYSLPTGRIIHASEQKTSWSIDSIVQNSDKYYTLNKERIVFGNSGIIPDYIIDDKESKLWNLLIERHAFLNYVTDASIEPELTVDKFLQYIETLFIYNKSKESKIKNNLMLNKDVDFEILNKYYFYSNHEIKEISSLIKSKLLHTYSFFNSQELKITDEYLEADHVFKKSITRFNKFDKYLNLNIRNVDKENNLIAAEIIIYNAQNSEIIKSFKNIDSLSVPLPSSIKYNIVVNKDGYFSESFEVDKTSYIDQLFLARLEIRHDFVMHSYDNLEEGEISIQINNIHFQSNKFELKNNSFKELDRIVELMKKQPDWNIEVIGHTDSNGSEFYNLFLSEKRVNSIISYLIEQGCEKNRLIGIGKGEKDPIATNNTEDGRKQNRRA